MEQLIVGLSVALLTGLTLLAYRHAQSYKRVANWVMLSILSAILGMTLWNAAVYQTQLHMISNGIFSFTNGSEEFDEMQEVLEGTDQKLIVPQRYIWLLALVNFYFVGLTYLPVLLRKEQEEKTKMEVDFVRRA